MPVLGVLNNQTLKTLTLDVINKIQGEHEPTTTSDHSCGLDR